MQDYTTKVCTKCKLEKPRSEFYDSTQSKGNMHCYCKSCYLRSYRAKVVRVCKVCGKQGSVQDVPRRYNDCVCTECRSAMHSSVVVNRKQCLACGAKQHLRIRYGKCLCNNCIQQIYAELKQIKRIKNRAYFTQYQQKERLTPRGQARKIVNTAKCTGKLIVPNQCEVCGIKCRPHAHHEDYLRPLDVTWLCNKCHVALHKQSRL